MKKYPDQLERILAHICSITNQILRICEDRGIRLLFMIIPGPVTGQPERKNATRERLHNLVGLTNEHTTIVDRVGDRFLDFLKHKEIGYCDLRTVFKNSGEILYFEGDGHINLSSQQLVAEHLVGVLGDLGQKIQA